MRKNVKLALIFNVLIVLMEVVALTTPNILEGFKNMDYGNYANLLALIASCLMVVFILIKKEVNEVPFIVIILRYMACVSLAFCVVTLFVVVIPMEGLAQYFDGIVKYNGEYGKLLFHVLCPIMSFVSFIFFEGDRRLNKKKTMYYPCLFTLVYFLIVVALVLTSTIKAPNVFTDVTNNAWYVSLCLVIGGVVINYLIARYVLLINQIKAPRIKLKR